MKRAPLPQNTDSSALVEPAHAPFVPSKPSRGGALVFGFVLAAAVFALTLTICYFGFGVLDSLEYRAGAGARRAGPHDHAHLHGVGAAGHL